MRADDQYFESRFVVPLRQAILLGVWVTLGSVANGAPAGDSPRRFEFTETHMAVPVKVAFYTGDEVAANRAVKEVYAKFSELNQLLSDYLPESELNQLCRSAPHAKTVPVSEPFWTVLVRSQQLAEQTDGAFDVTVGPMVRLWRRSRRQRELPTVARLEEARESTGWRNLKLDEAARGVQLLKPGMQLDLGGIAIGYAVDEGLKILKRHGITSAMIDASGDIGVTDAPPDCKGWRIGIAPLEPNAPPSRYLLLANSAVSTAGDAFQFVEIGGKRYSHIVDPKTGLGLNDRTAVTVVAPDCLTADGLDTAVNVLGIDAGMKLIEDHPGTAAIFFQEKNGKLDIIESTRWKTLQFDKP